MALVEVTNVFGRCARRSLAHFGVPFSGAATKDVSGPFPVYLARRRSVADRLPLEDALTRVRLHTLHRAAIDEESVRI